MVEVELRAAEDDLALIVHIVADDLHQSHLERFAARDGDHVDAEGRFEVGIFIENFQNGGNVGVPLHLDDGAHAAAVALVGDAGDGGKLFLLFLAEFRDPAEQIRLVDLVGKLRDDDEFAVPLSRLHADAGAQGDPALARFIGLVEFARNDVAPRGKVGRGDIFEHLVQFDGGLVDVGDDAVDRLPQVVGGNVGGKPHRDARSAVDEQVGEPAGEHVRLLQGVVEIERKADRILIEVAQKLERERFEPRLGVAHRRRGVAVHRAEIAVPVDERPAHVEVLRHAHHGVVNGAVAVGVVFAHAVADDTRRLLMRFVGQKPHFVHGV